MSETVTDQNSEKENPEETGERPHAPEIKQPGTASRLTYSLFSRETRSGRFFRSLGRWILTIVLLVGAGLLIGYLVFYQPLEQQLRETQSSLTTAETNMFTAQKDRDQAVSQRQQALTRSEEAQDQLSTELIRVRILRGMNSLKNAELAVLEKDGTAAKNAVNTAENYLKQIYSRLDRLDPTYSSSIDARFILVRNALNRDAESAANEIEALVSELSRMENELK